MPSTACSPQCRSSGRWKDAGLRRRPTRASSRWRACSSRPDPPSSGTRPLVRHRSSRRRTASPISYAPGQRRTERSATLEQANAGRRASGRGTAFAFGRGVLRAVSAPAEDQLRRARDLLASVRDALVEFGATEGDRAALAASIRQLEDLFLLV